MKLMVPEEPCLDSWRLAFEKLLFYEMELMVPAEPCGGSWRLALEKPLFLAHPKTVFREVFN